jgi:hypothetical protein
MLKVADKPSMDPVQQKLRLAKKQWNKDVSAFIDNLIHYKKLVNGQPNKFFKEKSFIKDPIPADPSTILGSLASDFQELAQRGNAIVAEQNEYSKTRRKKQPKQTAVAPVTQPSQPNLSSQLAAFESKYELVAEGSSAISRFFTKLLNPTWGTSEGARIKRYRMSLLDTCAKMHKDLERFQVEIVKSSNQSIIDAQTLLNNKIWHEWDLINKGLSTYRANMPSQVPDSGGPIKSPIKQVEDKKESEAPPPADEAAPKTAPTKEQEAHSLLEAIQKIQLDYSKNYKLLGADKMGGADIALEIAIYKFIKASEPMKAEAGQVVVQEYTKLVQALNQNLGTNATSIEDIAKQLLAKRTEVTASAEQLEKVAQNFLKKWVGKKMHQMSMFDKTSGFRLDIYKISEEVRVKLNKMMDSLEKEMNLDELTDLAVQINKDVTSLKGMTRALYAMAPKPKGKGSKKRFL